jgi:hypothetical protein
MKAHVAILVLLTTATVARADDYRHGRFLAAEPGVVVQPAHQAEAVDGLVNMPFLPGDRIFTTEGRAEVELADGTLVRLDGRSRLEYVSGDGGSVVLRLSSGAAIVQTAHLRQRPGVMVETPAAVVEAREPGLVRVDVRGSRSFVAVQDGEAVMAGVAVGTGEVTTAVRGEAPEPPRGFDPDQAADAFDEWSHGRDARVQQARRGSPHLPAELDAYAADLDAYGRWAEEPSVGSVWYPVVGTAWQPFGSGQWMWTAYGWTWVPSEHWGWVTSHYGRWGWSARNHGWYWVPRAGWSPAWVSWAVGPSYVGWAPLGCHDRPVEIASHGYGARPVGHAVPRRSWLYSSRQDMGHGKVKLVEDTAVAGAVRRIDGAHPDRDFQGRQVADADASRPPLGAKPTKASTRPGPGDTVPELRYDPRTTIPPAIPRRSRQHDEEDDAPPPSLAPFAGITASPAPTYWLAMAERKAPPSPRTEETDRDVLRRIFRQADQLKGRSGKEGKTASPPPSANPPAAPEKARTSPKKKKDGGS